MRLAEDGGQVTEQRMLHVGAVPHLVALVLPQEQPSLRQLLQLPRQGAGMAAGHARQFSQVETGLRLQEQHGQHPLPRAREQQVHQGGGVAH